MKLRLVSDNVLVRLDPYEEQTSGGLVIPKTSNAKERNNRMTWATVLDVGPGDRGYPVEVDVGDRVYMEELAGDNVRPGVDVPMGVLPDEQGVTYRIVRNHQIFLVA